MIVIKPERFRRRAEDGIGGAMIRRIPVQQGEARQLRLEAFPFLSRTTMPSYTSIASGDSTNEW
jgi:hypothetical protein